MTVKGIIKNIEEYVVHDGPGVRCIAFLKGCMIRCTWCQNPELIRPKPEIWFLKTLCKESGRCVEVCPTDAISMDSENKFDRKKCNQCGECVKVCRDKAFQTVGYETTAEDVFRVLEKGKPFYQDSDRGGITLSGGDPLFQPEFSAEILRLCREAGIHTAIETCLHAKYEDVYKVISQCNLLMCDIKHMDSEKHKQGTGVPNELILKNYERLNKDYEGEIYVRIPLIPGYNDDRENIDRTAKFLAPLDKVKGIDLLPFNPLPVTKYQSLDQEWVHKGDMIQSQEYLLELRKIVESYDRFIISIGGMW